MHTNCIERLEEVKCMGAENGLFFFLEERFHAQGFLDQKITENGNKIKI